MTDIEVYQPAEPTTPAVVGPVSQAELNLMMRQAELLSQANIIPKAYRDKPANILVAAMTGRSFGWDVLTAMRNGHVIEGVWALKPEAMLALIRKAGHSVNGETSPQGATVTGRRADNGDELTVSFSLNDAVRARLCRLVDGVPVARSDTGKVLPWEQYPQAMAWWRSVAQLARMLFSDVILGLSYTAEELGAVVDEEGEVIEVASLPSAPEVDDRFISAVNATRFVAHCAHVGLDPAAIVQDGTRGRTTDPTQVFKGEVGALGAALRAAKANCQDCTDVDVDGDGSLEPGDEPPAVDGQGEAADMPSEAGQAA